MLDQVRNSLSMGKFRSSNDIAAELCVHRVTVRRHIATLRREGCIESYREKVPHATAAQWREFYRIIGDGGASMEALWPPRHGWDTKALAACFGGEMYLNRERVFRSMFPAAPQSRMRERFMPKTLDSSAYAGDI